MHSFTLVPFDFIAGFASEFGAVEVEGASQFIVLLVSWRFAGSVLIRAALRLVGHGLLVISASFATWRLVILAGRFRFLVSFRAAQWFSVRFRAVLAFLWLSSFVSS